MIHHLRRVARVFSFPKLNSYLELGQRREEKRSSALARGRPGKFAGHAPKQNRVTIVKLRDFPKLGKHFGAALESALSAALECTARHRPAPK